MIEKKVRTRYVYVCDDCGWKGDETSTVEYAARSERGHRCGEHRQQHDSTGGYRGILGGYNVYCICGARWTTQTPGEPFACPKEIPQP